jgi:NADH-quinone oxidoreductase subunit L
LAFDIYFWIPWLVWVVPIAGAVLLPAVAKIGKAVRDWFAVAFSLIAALLAGSLFVLPQYTAFTLTGKISNIPFQVPWIPNPFGGGPITAGIIVSPLSAFLANVVAWVSFLIMVYSVGYMQGERDLTRYWMLMNYFIGNMLLLVLADNFLVLFVGWEGVGFCSYALIAFWHSDEQKYWVGTPGETAIGVPEAYSPTHAGMKAFIMTRVGDIAFLIGILMIFIFARIFNFLDLVKNPSWAGTMYRSGYLIPAIVLIFGGAVGKSAQFPLHEWLPDAMAGPTSVSSLIHAATMVNAGVFLVGTVGPGFYSAIAAQGVGTVSLFFQVGAWIGAFTAFLAATQAMVMSEVKKVLAYSTVSQIGYMMLGVGVAGLSSDFNGGFTGGFFHLASQALFKASLFMVAGWLIHVTESKYATEMGGLSKNIRLSFWAFLLASLSLAGIPPLSGFFSKDAILSAVLASNFLGNTGSGLGLYALGVATALITGFYSFRLLGMIFFGEKSPRLLEHQGEHPIKEAPPVMWVPFTILAGATLILGIIALPLFQPWLSGLFGNYLVSNFKIVSSTPSTLLEIAGIAVSLTAYVIGVVIAYFIYIKKSISVGGLMENRPWLVGVHKFLYNRWYINAAYYKVFAYPAEKISYVLFRYFEQTVIDPVNLGAVITFSKFAGAVKRIQTGVTEQYVFAFGVGIVLVVLLLIFV